MRDAISGGGKQNGTDEGAADEDGAASDPAEDAARRAIEGILGQPKKDDGDSKTQGGASGASLEQTLVNEALGAILGASKKTQKPAEEDAPEKDDGN